MNSVLNYREVLGVVLSGGRGTNMEPLTPYLDKPLIRLLGKPLIYYPTSNLVHLGLRTIYIISRDPTKVGNEVGRYFNNVSIEMLDRGGVMISIVH
ncbi:sugar phosphate nucleotidyltransferase [Vulcanisaeta distributa]|uniref:sugar phosphate nucleotidyltransferase n=1 Tax=Vulcanisaeta distributa TaxID=164451 RepID=UPI000AB22129|nr:sugar phosphate nucleotidyltransferase [Vulcanisaeta distributa]